MGSIWMDWDELKSASRNKRVVLWGRSDDWVHKTIQGLYGIDIEFIIDRSSEYQNTFFHGLSVVGPHEINIPNDEIFIVITSGSYESVIDSIHRYGYTNYCCSPVFKDWAFLHEMRGYNQNVLITSSDNDESEGGKRYSRWGGGLFILNTATNAIERKVKGHFRQIVEVDELYYVVEFLEKLVYVIHKDTYEVIQKYPLDQSEKQDQKPNSCGIAYYPEKRLFFVANTGDDLVNIYEKEGFKHTGTIKISQKSTDAGGGLHHINDLTISEDNLFVSCFSVSGNWKKEFMDGGLFEYDLKDLSKPPVILCNNLWKPHSVEFIGEKICYLDSMRGHLWIGNQKIAGTFQGFARALCHDGHFYYVAQSEAMYLKDVLSIRNNTILNSGVYLFDAKRKVSRFYSLPNISNIHDIIIPS